MPARDGASEVPTSLIQGYEILRTLNEGGMGRVYLAGSTPSIASSA